MELCLLQLSLLVYPKCINLFCIISVGLMPRPGNWRMSKTQNMSRELMKRDFCTWWNGKWAYLWADRTPHSASLAFFHFQCSVPLSLLQHWFRKLHGLIISPALMIFFSSSWKKCIVILIWAIYLLGNLFIHFLYEKAFRLGNPKLTLHGGSTLREVKLQTSEPLLIAPLKILFCALSLWNDLVF